MKAPFVVLLVLLTLHFQAAPAQPVSPSEETPNAVAAAPRSGTGLLELIEQLAESTGMEFVVDPRVRADPAYVGGSADMTYSKLLSILRVYGYAAVQSAGRVHVVPLAAARTLPTRLVEQDDPDLSDDEIVTRVITLDADTANMVPILRPMLPQHAHLASDGERSLVIVDHYDNVRRIAAIAEMLGTSPQSR
jgi:general secretion pathway protein D